MKTSLVLLAAAALLCGCRSNRGGAGSDYESASGRGSNIHSTSQMNKAQEDQNQKNWQGSGARGLSNTNSATSGTELNP